MGVTSKDNGYDALVKRVIGMKPVTVRVGLLEADGGQAHEGSDATLIEIAAWNYFGVLAKDGQGWHVPPRPWLGEWMDANDAAIREKLTVLMRSVVAGERTRQQALDAIGAWCVGQIQAHIAQGVLPWNAPSTVAAKRSDTPLVNHGILRSAQSYDIREGS
jgi:hypothetical protein